MQELPQFAPVRRIPMKGGMVYPGSLSKLQNLSGQNLNGNHGRKHGKPVHSQPSKIDQAMSLGNMYICNSSSRLKAHLKDLKTS